MAAEFASFLTGWSATNLVTGKTIYIKSAQRLRGEAKGADAKPPAQKTTKTPTAAKGGNRTSKHSSYFLTAVP